jgi:DeoR/GlpR family transcriptional regulator of sugar metabolism
MNIHQAQNHDEKVRIARAASQLVNPGESVVINCGSTAFLLGREMCGKPVQIITNYCRSPTISSTRNMKAW